MSTDVDVQKILKQTSLRVTAPRLAVLRVLASSKIPLSNTEVIERIGQTDWDPATIYRNLIKLRDAGIARVVSRAGGIDRYALAGSQNDHRHPHFICEKCDQITCLPTVTTSMKTDGPWEVALETAMIQLRGTCPVCLAAPHP